jgi:MFS family permease
MTVTDTPTSVRPSIARHTGGFWVIAAAFLVMMAFSAVPTPLYALYQDRDGFPTFMITVIFAAYAIGVMLSLYFFGHVSDWIGRRRIILAAILVNILSAVVFLAFPEIGGLIVARFINGVAIGALTATATAHLAELRAVSRPDESTSRSAIIAGVVNIGGLGLGPLVGGVLAQYVSGPLTVPYLIFLVLLVIAAVAVAFVPETVDRVAKRRPYAPQRVSLPAGSAPLFFSAGAGVFSAFSIFGLFMSLAPSFLAGTLHESSRVVSGLVPFAVFGSAALAQVVFARLGLRVQLVLSFVLMLSGVGLLATSVLVVNLPAFIVAGVLAGAGVGLQFRSSIGVAASLAEPGARGEVLAAVFLIAYTGLAVPVLLVGLALAFLPSTIVLVGFSILVAVLVVLSTPRMIIATRNR